MRHPNLRLGGAEMWKPEHRRAAERRGLRYPSDLTDAEWALVEPLIPPAKRGGRRREVNIREVLNAIFYVLSTGCQWQALHGEFPKTETWSIIVAMPIRVNGHLHRAIGKQLCQ